MEQSVVQFLYRVVPVEKGEAFLERALNEAARQGFRFVAVVGEHTVLEREMAFETPNARDGAALKVFKGDCPTCGERYSISVPERELWKARINPEARITSRRSPQCGHEIPINTAAD